MEKKFCAAQLQTIKFAALTYFKTKPIFCTIILKTHLIWDQKVGLIINTVRGCKLDYLQPGCT
jgi:hypothetical protein